MGDKDFGQFDPIVHNVFEHEFLLLVDLNLVTKVIFELTFE